MWQLRIVQEGPVGAHVSVARVSPDGKTLAVAYSNNLVELWHLGDDQRGERRPLVHDATVVQLEFSSDGRRLLARSRDLAQVWDVTTGKAIGPAIRHGGTLLAAAMSPDGTTLVTSGDDKRLRLWDLAAPTPSPKEMQQSLPTRLIAFRPDGKQLVSSDGLELRRWDAGTGRAVEPAMKHGAMVAALAFSRDGKRVITGTTQSPKLGSSTACLWDADTAKLQLELPIPGAGVNDVAFTSDGDVFAAITLEGLVQVRRADTGVLLTSPPARSGEIASIHFSPDGSQLVLGGRNGQVRFWDVAAGAEAGPVLYHEGGLRSCELSADGAWLVTTDGALRVWHRPDRTRRHAWPGGSRHVLALGFDSGGSRLLGATADGSSQVWSTESGGQLSRLSEQPAGFPCSAFSQSGELALTVGLDERVEAVRVWNTRDWSVRSRLIGHTGPVLAATFSPGGTFVITGGNDNTLRFWDPSSGGQLGPAQSLASPVVAVAVRADGRVAACGCRDGSVHLWRTESHERVGPPLALGGPVEFVGFTPDGQLAFAAGSAPEIKLWDAESGQLTLGLPAPNSFCQSVSVSPDRRFLVAGGFRRSTRIYSLGEGEPVGRPLQHQDVIRSVAFLGDGRTAVTASADSTARRWHVPTGIPIGPALRHARKLRLVTGSPDGRLVATGDWGGTIAVWEAPPEVTGSPSELRQWAGQITGVELEEAGAVRVLGAREWPPH
jgi:WD40 repeat protein